MVTYPPRSRFSFVVVVEKGAEGCETESICVEPATLFGRVKGVSRPRPTSGLR